MPAPGHSSDPDRTTPTGRPGTVPPPTPPLPPGPGEPSGEPAWGEPAGGHRSPDDLPEPPHRARRRRARARRAGCGCGLAAGIVALLAAVALVGGIVWLRSNEYIQPTPFEPRCRFDAAGNSTVLDLEQAHYAGIIVGRAVAKGLPPRAGSIAMATAYQESGIRNLDYGDRDSVGLFQQRPSQGWGTQAQILDPYYATDAFYAALVKVNGWETADITTVAQAVQKSGHPEAYRKHEQNARVIASVLSGQTTAGVTCGFSTPSAADPTGLATSMRKALGVTAKVSQDGSTLTATAGSADLAWAIGAHAVVNASSTGVSSVQVGDQEWRWAAGQLPAWTTVTSAGARTVTVTFRTPTASGSATPGA
ncbi:hypothetical protein [Raineyella sp.]|uniref:hypothetical protein n=1 Tax=Raineyella sp. TaxID=1911550 RepID=UPI002B1FCCA0|nr:hypothetical protein [Raineyella sp.]MEA5154766.1 hypothetical protein [Raineyella sp.]